MSGDDVPADPDCLGIGEERKSYTTNPYNSDASRKKFGWEEGGSDDRQESFNIVDMIIKDFACH